MSKKELTIRLVLFLTFSFVVPIAYIYIRCKLWKQVTTISFWFIIILAIAVLGGAFLIKYYLDGMKTKYSYLKQILEGFIRVILPIVIILAGALWFKSKATWLVENTNLLIEILSVILASELIAIIINPLPKWAFDNNIDGLAEITDKILHKEDE